jgi:hypothetical protein
MKECSKVLGTCIHGEVPEIYHSGYLGDWNTQVRLPPPKPQEKVLVGPSSEVSNEILKANVERRQKAQSGSLAEKSEAKTSSVPKKELEGDAAPEIVPKHLNMDEGANAVIEDCPKGPHEDDEDNLPLGA